SAPSRQRSRYAHRGVLQASSSAAERGVAADRGRHDGFPRSTAWGAPSAAELVGRCPRRGSSAGQHLGWRSFPFQPLAFAPAFRQDKPALPEATFIFPRDDFPGRYPRVVCDRPAVSHHLDFEARLTHEAVPAQLLGLKVLVLGSKEGYRLLADQLLEEPS